MALTLSQRYGDGVTFNPSAKTLTIDLNDLSSILVSGVDLGLDISGMTDANKDEYADGIFWALVQRQREQQPDNNNDETVGIYVTNRGKTSATRNGVAQFAFNLNIAGYKNDTEGVNLDPDAIGS
ncbi:MAG: hypothetical protein AAGJ80_09995 [Cyanobacteria bacterium J06553_1]